ncbi:MAG: aminomethyl-transferring glycine dehydrogenase subunit GcvPA [Anaerolineae bacterium]|nr:aminomethyl-transferring glycine dehydrogenase subunit GcvPA [Anaerolineae bacterium]
MVYVPHTDDERRAMLASIGVDRIEDLFSDIPQEHRYPELGLPPAASELEILQELRDLAAANLNAYEVPTFLGAGAYRHWAPSVVDYIISRGEFATAYTPYQPEISQGTLQAIFEYQSMICDLTGMEVSNASHYDGATAAAEAVIQALNVFRMKRRKVVIAPTVHPQYREVVRTYTQGMGLEIVGDDDLTRSLEEVVALVDKETACLILQSPNFFGEIELLEGLGGLVHEMGNGALLAVATNPISLGLLNPPGAFDVDIVMGEGQPLGLGLNFGGPYLGFYACRKKHLRQIAGRLVGEAHDVEGQRGYALTLTTREQHIRRERATSNICTNQGLMMLAATVYLSVLGKQGLRKIAELNYHKAHYAAQEIDTLDTFSVVNTKPFFNEFVVRCPAPVEEINDFLLSDYPIEIIGGYDLGRDYPHLQNHMLVAVTEMNSREEIDDFVSALAEDEAHEVIGGHTHD